MNIPTKNPAERLAVSYDKDMGISLLYVPDLLQPNHYHIELSSYNCRKLISQIESTIVKETLDNLDKISK